MADESRMLVRLDSACRALAEARTIGEVKDMRDKAQAIQDAAELKVRAELRLVQAEATQQRAACRGYFLLGVVAGSCWTFAALAFLALYRGWCR